MSDEQVAEVPEEGVAQSVEAEDWRVAIPEEIRSHRSLSTIPDVGALAKSYVHAQQMIGADKVVVPSDGATDEQWNEFYEKIGRPADPGQYEIQSSDGDIPEMVDWYRQTAHELGLNNRQAGELFARYNEFAQNMNASGEVNREQFVAQAEADLRAEFGPAFEERIENGRAIVDQFSNPEIMEMQMADGTLLGDNPEFIKMVMHVGEFISSRMGEDQLEGMKVSNAMTVQDAHDELSKIRQKGSPFWKSSDPDHDKYVQRALELQEMIHG